jgi:hypothetical protein
VPQPKLAPVNSSFHGRVGRRNASCDDPTACGLAVDQEIAMRSYEPDEPMPDVLLLFGMALGSWAAIGIVVLTVWPPRPDAGMGDRPLIAAKAHVADVATTGKPATRAKAKVKGRKRSAPVVAARPVKAINWSVN